MRQVVFITKNVVTEVKNLTLSFLKLKEKQDKIRKQNRRFWRK